MGHYPIGGTMADSDTCPEKPGLDGDAMGQLAATPKKVVGDEGSVEERSLTEQIALDKYRSVSACGTTQPPFGMYLGVVRPKGTV